MGTQINEKLLDEALTRIEGARAWGPRVIAKLESLVRSGDDFAIFRINPLRYARETNTPENDAIDLFLHAANAGLCQMNWHLLCPVCGKYVENFATLGNISTHFFCDVCQLDSDASLDDFIGITFTVSPAVRESMCLYPDKLSVEDMFLRYYHSPDARVSVDGPRMVDVMRDAARAMTYLEPGRTTVVELDAQPMLLHCLDHLVGHAFDLFIAGDPITEPQHVRIRIDDKGFTPDATQFRPGKVVATFDNQLRKRVAIAAIHFTPDFVPGPCVFDPFLTGKRLLTTQTFRDLFRSEVIRSTQGINVKELTFLFTDLKGSTEMYERIGDLKAFGLVQQHFDSLGRVVQDHGGVLVKTIGDAVMASFLNPIDAVGASVKMLREIEEFNARQGHNEIILKIGVHRGPSIAVTMNDRLDYFGQSVNIAARVQGLAEAEQICVTGDVYDFAGVPNLLAGLSVQPEMARLKGIQSEMQVYRLSYSAMA